MISKFEDKNSKSRSDLLTSFTDGKPGLMCHMLARHIVLHILCSAKLIDWKALKIHQKS